MQLSMTDLCPPVPLVVPRVGRVVRSAPPPGLPAAAPMSRAPPPPAPVSLPALTIFSRNRSCVYFSVPTSSTAPPGPGFRVCGPPSGPRVSARAFHVSVDRCSPWASVRMLSFTMVFFVLLVHQRTCVLGPFLHAGCAGAACVRVPPRQRHGCGGSVPGTAGGRRALVGSPLATAQAPGSDVRAGAWGAGRLGVFPRCCVGHAWTLGLVRRPMALSGLFRRSPSGARRVCCVGGGCCTERFLTMRTLREARS